MANKRVAKVVKIKAIVIGGRTGGGPVRTNNLIIITFSAKMQGEGI